VHAYTVESGLEMANLSKNVLFQFCQQPQEWDMEKRGNITVFMNIIV
jgi:hypothetical protein